MTEDFERAEHDPKDPNPWLALYLDTSLPLPEPVKAALLGNNSSYSRQFLLPLIRPFAMLAIALIKVVKTVIPNWFTSSRILHLSIYWGLKWFVRPDANWMILRHFHIGSELLQFVASNAPGIEIPLHPLRPRNLEGLIDNVFLQHDLNIYNFIIRLNRGLKAKGLQLTKRDNPDFSAITDGPFNIDASSIPRRWLNFVDLETAIEIYTPLYQLFLTDSDFWRACNSLQLDETIAVYAARIVGDPNYLSLINNKHPLVPLPMLRAGYRLMLHGLAAESLHANLVALKRRSAAVPSA